LEVGGDDDFMFGDMDSLENSLDVEDVHMHMGGESPLSSFLNKTSTLRVEFGACTKLGPKTKQEDRFVMTPSLGSVLPDEEVEGYDAESNTHRCDNAYAAVYDGECR
jgi:hypothetical protein